MDCYHMDTDEDTEASQTLGRVQISRQPVWLRSSSGGTDVILPSWKCADVGTSVPDMRRDVFHLLHEAPRLVCPMFRGRPV